MCLRIYNVPCSEQASPTVMNLLKAVLSSPFKVAIITMCNDSMMLHLGCEQAQVEEAEEEAAALRAAKHLQETLHMQSGIGN